MSHSTNILIKLSLDIFDLDCGSRRPAEAFGVAVGQSKTLTDGEASEALWKLPQSGAGRTTRCRSGREVHVSSCGRLVGSNNLTL